MSTKGHKWDHDEIGELCQQGYTQADIAFMLNAPISSVHYIVTKNGFKKNPKQMPKRTKNRLAKITLIKHLYYTGDMTQREISKEMGVHYSTVQRLMVESGMKLRSRNEANKLAWKHRRQTYGPSGWRENPGCYGGS